MKSLFTLIIVCLFAVFADAETATNEAILAELRKLNANLEHLEQRLDDIDQRVDAVESVSAATIASAQTAGPPNPSLIDRMVEAVQAREESIRYPWMDTEIWSKVKKGMSEEEVVDILGEPTLEDPSLYKRIDKVHTYRGRRPMTGELVFGKVKFYRNKVVSIETP